MKSSDFDYELPESLIAHYPLDHRDDSRLLVLDRVSGEIADKGFKDIINYIEAGDLLVFNDSRVMAARTFWS